METESPDQPPPIPQTEYRVVPFVASIGTNATADAAAAQLQEMV